MNYSLAINEKADIECYIALAVILITIVILLANTLQMCVMDDKPIVQSPMPKTPISHGALYRFIHMGDKDAQLRANMDLELKLHEMTLQRDKLQAQLNKRS